MNFVKLGNGNVIPKKLDFRRTNYYRYNNLISRIENNSLLIIPSRYIKITNPKTTYCVKKSNPSRQISESTMKGTRPLDNSEIMLVSACFDGTFATRNRGLFLLGVSTGGRISELLSLTIGDVYQNGRAVTDLRFDRSIVKGGEVSRAVPVNRDCREIKDPRFVVRGERGKARFNASTRRKEPRIKRKPVAPADRCAIAPSSQKATCLFFAYLIHSLNPVLGGIATRR